MVEANYHGKLRRERPVRECSLLYPHSPKPLVKTRLPYMPFFRERLTQPLTSYKEENTAPQDPVLAGENLTFC